MKSVMNDKLQDREQAGQQLSEKLITFRNTNAVVVGIPHGGVCVASAIARSLGLPLEVICCRKIKDPADKNKYIGSLSANDVMIHANTRSIPQDYIYHQLILLRNSIQYENKLYYGDAAPPSFLYKTVILVDDVLQNSDAMIACLREIKKQKPLNVVVAVPVVSAEAVRVVRAIADDMVFLKIEPYIHSGKDYYVNFPKIGEAMVKELLITSRRPPVHFSGRAASMAPY
jgi:putative phosphoribosyl transferase